MQRQHAESAVASCAMRFRSHAPAGCRAQASPSRTTSAAKMPLRAAAARFPGPKAATATAEGGPSSSELRRSPTMTSCARPAARARAGASCAAAAGANAAPPPRHPRRRRLLCCSALPLAGSHDRGPQRRSRRRRIAARTCCCWRPHAFVGGAHPELLRAAATKGMQHRQQASWRRGGAPAAPRRRRRTCSVSVASSSWSSPALIKRAARREGACFGRVRLALLGRAAANSERVSQRRARAARHCACKMHDASDAHVQMCFPLFRGQTIRPQ